MLPVRDAVFARELRAVRRVLLKFDVEAVRVFTPALPRLVAAEFFGRHGHAPLRQPFADGVHVVHFKTEMVDALVPDVRRGAGAENFHELPRRSFKIKAEQLAVLVEIEMRFQAERVAVKFPAALQVGGNDAEMRDGFDHAPD
jgi:hypothetical protein